MLAVFGEWLFDITQNNVVDQKNKFYRLEWGYWERARGEQRAGIRGGERVV